MHSKIKIAGHPVHPMLVAFPAAFYAGTLLSAIGVAVTIAAGFLGWTLVQDYHVVHLIPEHPGRQNEHATVAELTRGSRGRANRTADHHA